jgi:hypothetical protein
MSLKRTCEIDYEHAMGEKFWIIQKVNSIEVIAKCEVCAGTNNVFYINATTKEQIQIGCPDCYDGLVKKRRKRRVALEAKIIGLTTTLHEHIHHNSSAAFEYIIQFDEPTWKPGDFNKRAISSAQASIEIFSCEEDAAVYAEYLDKLDNNESQGRNYDVSEPQIESSFL